jgi:hypothetical protein
MCKAAPPCCWVCSGELSARIAGQTVQLRSHLHTNVPPNTQLSPRQCNRRDVGTR